MVKVFDLDGTILDSNGVWRGIDETFVARRGKQLTPEYNEYVAHAIFPDAAHFTREYYGLEESEEAIMAEWRGMAYQAYAEKLPLKPGVKAYLAQCAQKGERIVLYTSSDPTLCRAALEHHGIIHLFDGLYFAQELRMEKKYPESFHKLSALLGQSEAECILFDDSPVACASAHAAGWRVVGVADAFFAPQEPKVRSASHRFISGFPELLD